MFRTWARSREVVLLGMVSFLTDVSSEAIFAVLPLFVTTLFGASALMLGAMEGLADFAASSLDMASGYLADLHVRYLPYGELEKHREAMARFGQGLKAIDAIARDLA